MASFVASARVDGSFEPGGSRVPVAAGARPQVDHTHFELRQSLSWGGNGLADSYSVGAHRLIVTLMK
jgi:hypothetical protein